MSDRTRARILIVEDDRVASYALMNLFISWQCDVAAVDTVLGGVEALDAFKPDLVILDLVLKDGDGAEILDKIRTCLYPALVVVSTCLGPEEIGNVKAMFPDSIIFKPYRLAEVKAIVAGLVEKIRDRQPV